MNKNLKKTLQKFQAAMTRLATKQLLDAQKVVSNRFQPVKGGLQGASGFIYR